MSDARSGTSLFALMAAVLLLSASHSLAEQPKTPAAGPTTAADAIADFFGQVGDQIYEHCIFELSEEQLEVQQALIQAYVKQGASDPLARQLAVKQIQPPELSDECKRLKQLAKAPPAPPAAPPAAEWKPKIVAVPRPSSRPSSRRHAPAIPLTDRKVLPQWDCAPGIDYVTIHHRGYERKLTGGDICSPFEDVIHAVPESVKTFRLGYAITTGRLFVVSDDPRVSGKTITWAISGREACRNNPDPDCLAARAIGPLPPGQYAFASGKNDRVSWGPTSKRMVAGIFLTKLWNRDRFSRAQTAAILARGNIAIHVRLKGEMTEACLGLEQKGWDYISRLVKDGRATGVDVHLEEPYPKIAEQPPVIRTSSFSLSSLFQ